MARADKPAAPGSWRPGRPPWWDLSLVALAVIFALPSLWYPFGRDQAAHAYIGWNWLHGLIPFRDAVDQKPPGIYLLYSLGSALFGQRQFGIRAIDLLGILTAGWLAARAARESASRLTDGIAAAAALVPPDASGSRIAASPSVGAPRVGKHPQLEASPTPNGRSHASGSRRPHFRSQSGATGASILLLAGFYYCCFDYWNSAQTEIWQGLAVLAGVEILREDPRARRAAFLSGVLGGVAVLFKFTAAVLCLGLAGILTVRAWRRGGSRRERAARILGGAGLQILGAFAVVGLAVAYFAAHGALRDAVEILVRYNLAYGAGWRTELPTAVSWSLDFWVRNCGYWALVIVAGWIWAVVAARRRGERRAWEMALIPGGLLALGALAVAVQGKFFSYHWGVLAPFLGLAGAHGLHEAGRLRPRLGPAIAVGAVLVGFLLAPQWICNRAARNPRPTSYLRQTAGTWNHLRGGISRAEFLRPFDGGYSYRYADEEVIGRTIRDRARPGDRLLVRGFEPAIYTVSGLRCPSRFFIELPLTERRVAIAREKWIAEYRRTLNAEPPRFVVLGERHAEQVGDLDKHGYRRAEQCGKLVLYERRLDGKGDGQP